jgi:hypothetical protein
MVTAMTDLHGIVAGLDEQTYHAHPSFSSTQAKRILESPARFKWRLDNPEPSKKEYDVGSAAHSKVLGTGYSIIEIPEELLSSNGSISTAAAKAFVADVRAEGKIPVKAAVVRAVDAMAEAVLAHPTARRLVEQDGIPEASVFSTDPDSGVKLRARFDYLAPEPFDFKTIGTTASTDDFAKNVASYGYDVQWGHYRDTLHYATGDLRDMVFVVVEADAPHLVAVHQLDPEFREMGTVKARRARDIWRQCTETGVWPGYSDDITIVKPPMWAVYEFEEKYAPERAEMVV